MTYYTSYRHKHESMIEKFAQDREFANAEVEIPNMKVTLSLVQGIYASLVTNLLFVADKLSVTVYCTLYHCMCKLSICSTLKFVIPLCFSQIGNVMVTFYTVSTGVVSLFLSTLRILMNRS